MRHRPCVSSGPDVLATDDVSDLSPEASLRINRWNRVQRLPGWVVVGNVPDVDEALVVCTDVTAVLGDDAGDQQLSVRVTTRHSPPQRHSSDRRRQPSGQVGQGCAGVVDIHRGGDASECVLVQACGGSSEVCAITARHLVGPVR